MRDVLEEILTHAGGHRRRRRSPRSALHEAVLDQHRSLQQPDRPQVRAEMHARRRSPRRRDRRRRTARESVAGRSRRALRACLFFDPDVDPIVTSKTPGPGKDILAGEREQPVRRRHDGGPRGVRGAVSAELAPGQAATAAGRRGVPGRRPLRPLHPRDRPSPERGDAVRDRRRWRTRCAR